MLGFLFVTPVLNNIGLIYTSQADADLGPHPANFPPQRTKDAINKVMMHSDVETGSPIGPIDPLIIARSTQI